MNLLLSPFSIFKTALVIVLITLVSGCQLTAKNNTEYSYYGSYYLWIKSLDNEELTTEIKNQQLKESQGNQAAEYHLLLLHSLPNSPIHNPYSAKSRLNQQALIQEAQAQFNVGDLAFIIMLRDQLNQQLLILNKLINKEKTNTETQKQLQLQQQSIEMLEMRSQKLQQQIIQLKKIERSINDHGTSL
ncbi:hypothetical protein [Thalassotalea piscium]|uniref:Uncharacterized protein n=1 Tax=Thalassotalea piscium TaxID=1230533 RepID=A0A7X0NKG8_9GAMM|nr:hypothetical protein [Thalassotalea piscium]MBB6544971.1 hypothetical protein [Thalassotalea piscium]